MKTCQAVALFVRLVLVANFFVITSIAVGQDDPLSAWLEGPAKEAIVNFVKATTTPGTPSFLALEDRIAVFDNDGTLWPENPVPFQLAFVIDELKRLAEVDNGLRENAAFKAALQGDIAALTNNHYQGLLEIFAKTHAGMTTEEFTSRVRSWSVTSKHPRYDRPYVDLAYHPMLQVLTLLRDHGYKTFIVSGGGVDFMRVWSQEVYGIPPEQVVGSIGPASVEYRDGAPVIIKQPGLFFMDDKEGKIIGIHRQIGRRPAACFGNSDGDVAMMQWTTIGRSPSLGVIVHHTDPDREYAYDKSPQSSGKLIEGLEQAASNHWVVVDMKNDWKTMFKEIKDGGESGSETPSPAVPPAIPLGVEWVVEDVMGAGVIDNSRVFIQFDADRRVVGSTGCNRFSGTVDINGNQIVFGPLATTRRGCAPALMNQETQVSRALEKVKTYRLDEEKNLLYFLDANSQAVLRMSR
jgi:heat shock protein HslJ